MALLMSSAAGAHLTIIKADRGQCAYTEVLNRS